MARGYLNRPAVTAASFVPDPFRGAPGARMYRTGDRARWLASGEIQFLGRLDQQVKIRGFRIELGEIEAAIGRHPLVREAVALARADGAGGHNLVAYVTGHGNGPPAAAELRAFLRTTLPEYMLPAAFVFLEKLPLTPNGKLNRGALPAPEAVHLEALPSYARPLDGVELALCAIWEQLLRLPAVGIRDHFFEIGGHSLLAIQLIAAIERQFGCVAPAAVLLRHPTIEGLAEWLRGGGSARREALVPLRNEGSRRPFFCVHPVGGNVLCYQELSRRLGAEQPFFALQSPEPGLQLETVDSMAAFYVEALRGVQPRGPYALGGWSMGGVIAAEMARQLVERGETVELLALIDSHVWTDPRAAGLSDDDVKELFLEDLEGLTGQSLDVSEPFEAVLERLRALAAVPAGFNREQLRGLYELFRINLRALAVWTPKPYAGQIDLFRATASAAEPGGVSAWTRVAARVAIHDIEADHHSILIQPAVEGLAARLGLALQERNRAAGGAL